MDTENVVVTKKVGRGRPRIRKPGEMTQYMIHIRKEVKEQLLTKCQTELRVPSRVLNKLIEDYISGNIKI